MSESSAGFHDFPEQEIGQLISVIGNSEKKCALQLLVKPGESIGIDDLNRRFEDAQLMESMVEYAAKSNLAQTLAQSHSQVDVFEIIGSNYGSEWRAKKSRDSKLADAVAGHQLDLSSGMEPSLYEIYGKTAVNDQHKKSPQIRLAIYDALDSMQGRPASLGTLSELAGISKQTLNSHILKLHKLGMLEYSATHIGEIIPRFEIIKPIDSVLTSKGKDGRVQRHGGVYDDEPTLRNKLSKFLNLKLAANETTFTYEEAESIIGSSYGKSAWQKVVSRLCQEEYLKPKHMNPIVEDKLSSVYLTPEQQSLINRIVAIQKGLIIADQDFLNEGISKGKDIINDPTTLSKLLNKCHNREPWAKRKSFEETGQMILKVLSSKEAPTSTQDIHQKIQEIDPGHLSKSGLYTALRKMKSAGLLDSTKNGTYLHWHSG